ncbi:MAG: metal ABC transporter permease, partial [Coriobacteriia bacterium]|nr:metal ABC transporter permease [Coriobacteriia bacterium]
MEIFSYQFMRMAFVVGILLAIIIPMLGMNVVLRHLSMMGDALSHFSLAGVAAGLIAGLNPILGALIAAIIGALSIQFIREKLPHNADVAIAIVSSTGIGIAGILSGFVKNATDFNSFLFGSIVAISEAEFRGVIILALVIFVVFALFWREFELMAFDEKLARLSGVPVNFMNFLLTIIIALAIAIASRAVGALIVSGIMVVPVICGLLLGKGYRQ